MKDKEIEILRDKINDLDNQMLDIMDQRSYIVTEIGKLKDKKKGIIDKNREQNVIDRLINLTRGKYSKDSIIRIWRELFEASSKLQIKNNFLIETKRSIENISIYKGGKTIANPSERNNFKDEIIKLSSNENSLGASKYISLIDLNYNLNRYPEINGITLRKKIAELHKIDKNQIVLGCGSDEILLFAALSFCRPGDEIIHAEHGFEMYSIITKIVGAVSKLAEEKNYKVSVKSICEKISPATKLIYLANPNNPSGSYLTKKEIRDLMNTIPKNIVVLLDGAYAEYVMEEDYDSDFSLIDEYENIIITRTFSKAYGLASIRLGWCYSSERISSILNRVKGPFNTNTFAHKLALIALKDQEHIKMVTDENKINKKWFEEELKKLNIKFYPSFANFSFIESSEKGANNIFNSLLEKGIIVRQLDSYNLPNCLRITIGTKDEMNKTISVLKGIM
jgi:histidinol-phosphate aminotransferase